MRDNRQRTDLILKDSEVNELRVYNNNGFKRIGLDELPNLPLASEPFADTWAEYATEAENCGVWRSLQKRLVQLHFPIEPGISSSDPYRAATLKGKPIEEIPEATGLQLKTPKSLRLILHPTQAGEIPLIVVPQRKDFVTLLCALVGKNEPLDIPDYLGAMMVSGLNNWDRIESLKHEWEKENPVDFTGLLWAAEFQRIIKKKELYQDRFIILSAIPYSGVSADEMELPEDEWLKLSLIIRQEHECTHYFTKRVLGSMQNRLMDELMADYIGIRAALGYFRADWFLRFMGLEKFSEYLPGSRIEHYCNDANLSPGAFKGLQAITIKAAQNLEQIDKNCHKQLNSAKNRAILVILLAHCTLDKLADLKVIDRISQDFQSTVRHSPIE